MPRRSALLFRTLLFACLLGLALPASVAPAGAVPAERGVVAAQPQPGPDRATRAQHVLDRVTDLLKGVASPSAAGHQDLTIALRDLALLRDALPSADRARADALLARPTANPQRCPDVRCYHGPDKQICSAAVCVHWVPKSEDSTNGVRGTRYVHHVLTTVTKIYDKYVAAGYHRPISDRGRGGNNKPDIYLAQIGDRGLYGYCAPEGPRGVRHGRMWGYCVLDNNYSHAEFPAHTPLQNMKVTAAHEFFHDVQFSMDAGDDGWFMEATATWAEDIVFDKINDNAFYLPYGPIAHPTDTSLDTFTGLYHYGAWIFFRYLTDRYGTKTAGMPDLVLDMWKGAAGTNRGHYSLKAVKAALADEGTDLTTEFARFSAGNRRPQDTYAGEVKELAKQRHAPKYPKAPLADSTTIGQATGTVTESRSYKHLTARTFRFVPGTTAPAGSQLTLDLTLGGHGAAVIVVKQDGSAPTRQLVTADGPQTPIVFEDGATKWVEVTVVNASSRFNCWSGSPFSCSGAPQDDGLVESVSATVS